MLGRNYTISSTILIIVLLLHILFLIACSIYTITYKKLESPEFRPAEPYIYIPMTEQAAPPSLQPITEPTDNKPGPEPIQKEEDMQPISPEDPHFASLFNEVEQPAIPEKTIEQEKTSIITGKGGTVDIHVQDTGESVQQEKSDTQMVPPKETITDDMPIPFVGINTTTLTERDTLFHQFIKAVNSAIYASMHQSNPPYTPGAQPVLIRLVIVRTGRLAQTPTILRSSGNPQRDAWYINAIKDASAKFPPIPPAIHLPFAELTYKEGMRAGSPIH